jgi:hypothetical protein
VVRRSDGVQRRGHGSLSRRGSEGCLSSARQAPASACPPWQEPQVRAPRTVGAGVAREPRHFHRRASTSSTQAPGLAADPSGLAAAHPPEVQTSTSCAPRAQEISLGSPPVSGRETTNGSAGPFDGRHLRCALERLGYRIAYDPQPNECAVFIHAVSGNEVYLDLDWKRVYYGDRAFRGLAAFIVNDTRTSGTGRRGLANAAVQLRSAAMECLRLLGPPESDSTPS